MLDCAKFVLWDADSNSLVSIESFLQGASSKPELAVSPPKMAMNLK
jgi:acyl-lipid omega-6 desaturase (Delta-12 desaturase)